MRYLIVLVSGIVAMACSGDTDVIVVNEPRPVQECQYKDVELCDAGVEDANAMPSPPATSSTDKP
jgi:hypothetical protein